MNKSNSESVKNFKLISFLLLLTTALVLLISGGNFIKQNRIVSMDGYPQIGVGGGPEDESAVQIADAIIRYWPVKSRETAYKLIRIYGQPDDITTAKMTWNFKTPWKKIVVYRSKESSQAPDLENYILEQTINYDVDGDEFDLLVTEDGFVKVEKSRGELVAGSESEELNFLAVNLANDILSGKQSPAQAKKDYSKNRQLFLEGENVPYTQRLVFYVPPAGRVRLPQETIMR